MKLNLDLSDKMILKAFYLCKMTVWSETTNGNVEYTFIHWPEFLEFLPRLAWLKYLKTYQHSSWTLYRKTKVLLDDLFKLVANGIVKEPPTMCEDISDSDDDY